ncbi:hypothetical protein DPMN_043670 [Dreissena polymorpha]|uniref:Secreted protein n=1 Tax=Dreissena polymorpha TaxID=45954 RepID=A0A9D4HY26_DREPO|nr:hypothetical protein DPMN_043670 [Dreissena polymorpha]
MFFWYWSLSLQKMVNASLLSIPAFRSISCSLLVNRLREPVCAMDTRAEQETDKIKDQSVQCTRKLNKKQIR